MLSMYHRMHCKLLLAFLLSTIIFSGCKKEGTPTSVAQSTVTDADLLTLVQSTTTTTYYRHSLKILPHSSGSGHSDFPFLRTRYNTIAATQLDINGQVKKDAIFPDSSLIIKELFNADTTIGRFALLFKSTRALNADANGWVWAEIATSGTVAYSVSNKGAGCIGCHSAGINFTRMNDSFP